jgi:hypothetical protein
MNCGTSHTHQLLSPRNLNRSSPRKRGSSFVLLAALSLFPAAAHAQSQWATYTNVRFAFAVDYPSDIFTSYAEPDNSDGATFKTKEPWVELRAWGSYNVEKQSPRAAVAERYAGTTLDYSSVKRDSYVVSGIERGAIFYDRCNFTGDRVLCIALVYPAAQKEKWDKIVTRVSRSLRVVRRGALTECLPARHHQENGRQGAVDPAGHHRGPEGARRDQGRAEGEGAGVSASICTSKAMPPLVNDSSDYV